MRWPLSRRVLVQFIALLDGGDAFFEHAEPFFDMRQGAQADLDGTRPIVEGSEHFGLHVAHLLDEVVAETVQITAKFNSEFVQVLLRFQV
jgi:hypothetical protein